MSPLLLSVAVLTQTAQPVRAEPAVETPAREPSDRKLLIEWGWDEPDTRFLRDHIDQMERLPFDGVVFHITSSRGGNFTWNMWGGRRFEHVEFQHSIRNLQATQATQLTEWFLRVNVTPGDVDWFDDDRWLDVLANMDVAANGAKRSGCRGFMFDVEQYQGQLWDWSRQPPRDFDEYRKQVRKRGAFWMRAVNARFPDITVLLTFAYDYSRRPNPEDPSTSPYGLLADFLDGMLGVATDETVIVDAWESSYGYREQSQFRKAYDTTKRTALDWTSEPQAYAQRMRTGFGLWMDYDWYKNGWNESDLEQNYFSPEEFENSLRHALRASDRYVWVYTEHPRWWTAEKLPDEYVDAVRSARQSYWRDDN